MLQLRKSTKSQQTCRVCKLKNSLSHIPVSLNKIKENKNISSSWYRASYKLLGSTNIIRISLFLMITYYAIFLKL